MKCVLLAAWLMVGGVAGAMDLGGNFWNLRWHKASDCFQDVANVSGDNPWNPQFLKEIAIYHSLRFMDWDYTNGSTRDKWTARPRKDAPDQRTAAYEWMIDLCNQTGADLWLCTPHPALHRDSGDGPSDYALRLCLLVKTGVDMGETDLGPLLPKLAGMDAADLVKAGGVKTCEPLRPELRFYIEYSNETWNGSFKQSHYCCAEGQALKLAPDGKTDEKGENWNAGFRFHAWAAARNFHAADLVFGRDSRRVVRVLAQQAGSTFQARQHAEVLASTKWNPSGAKADAIAIAPYFGRKVPGDAPDAVERLRAEIQESARKCAGLKEFADGAGAQLIAYEGGQHVMQKAAVVNRNPAMYDLYMEYLGEMAKYISHFCHYAHVGKAGDRGCWGALEFTGQPADEAPKFRALRDWSAKHPRPEQAP